MAELAITQKQSASSSAVVIALKDAAATAFVVFMLTILMVGFETQAQQGQFLSYVTRYQAVIWGVVLVPVGRFGLTMDRLGYSKPAYLIGGVGFLYLFVVPVLQALGAFYVDEIPVPFAD